MSKIKIAIAGSGGRMGRALIEGVMQAGDMALHAALEHSGTALLGRDAGELAGAALELFFKNLPTKWFTPLQRKSSGFFK